jgi:ATP-dependent Clp protease ATP-binding subunit ClpX
MSEKASVKHIKKHLDTYVAGQEQAKDVIATAAFIHVTKTLYRLRFTTETQIPMKSSNVVLLGPSGCGKTYLAQTTARGLGLPFIEINARALTQEGYKGNSISDIFEKFYYNQTPKNRAKMGNSIVLIDEYDKICMENRSTGGWDLSIQHSLLKIMEGTEVQFPERAGSIDTSHMMFILSGNFELIRKVRKASKSSIGFTNNNNSNKKPTIQEELIKAGVIPEVAGRLSLVGEVLPLTKEELRYAFTEADNSIYKQYKELYKEIYGKTLRLTSEQVDKIIDISVQRNLGARGLHSALDEYLIEHLKKQSINIEEFLDEFTFLS